MGGQDLTDAVADRMGVNTLQAEAMKQELGLSAGTGDQGTAAARVIEAAAAKFLDEVRGSLDYYTASTGSTNITRLVLTGGGSRLAGLAERLQTSTRIPVVTGNPMEQMAMGRTGLTPEQIQFVEPLAVVPVGLALGAVR